MSFFEAVFSEMFSGFASGEPRYIVSQLLGLVTLVLAVLCVQFNDRRAILITQLLTNGLCVACNLLNGAYPGCALCAVAILQLLFNYYYQHKNTEPPAISNWLFLIPYIGAVLLSSERLLDFDLSSFDFWVDLLPMLAAFAFAFAVAAKKPSGYRLCILVNALSWIVYDYYGGDAPNLSLLLTHALEAISTVVGIVRLDILKRTDTKTAEVEEDRAG